MSEDMKEELDMLYAISDDHKVSRTVIALYDAAYMRGWKEGYKSASTQNKIEQILAVIMCIAMIVLSFYAGKIYA